MRCARHGAQTRKKTESQVLSILFSVPLLVIDEIGVQYGTDSEQNILFDVMDRRYRDMMPTILLANLKLKREKPEDPAGLREVLGERIYDRLTETGRASSRLRARATAPRLAKESVATRAQANQLLDFVRAGGDVPESEILCTVDYRRPDGVPMTCITCAHWSPKQSGQLAKHSFAVCAIGPSWKFWPRSTHANGTSPPRKTLPKKDHMAQEVKPQEPIRNSNARVTTTAASWPHLRAVLAPWMPTSSHRCDSVVASTPNELRVRRCPTLTSVVLGGKKQAASPPKRTEMPADTSLHQGSSPLHGDGQALPMRPAIHPLAAPGASTTATAAPAWTGTHPCTRRECRPQVPTRLPAQEARSTWP